MCMFIYIFIYFQSVYAIDLGMSILIIYWSTKIISNKLGNALIYYYFVLQIKLEMRESYI
jgi:hypothetical protein